MVVFTLPFAAVGVGMGVWLAGTLATYFSARNWVETPARIVRTDLKVDAGNDAVAYQVTAEYLYEYGGQKYTGDRVGLSNGADNIGPFQQDAYRELSNHKKSQRPFRCYVNPARPAQALLYRDLRWETVGLQAIFVLVFGGAGFGGLIGGLMASRNRNRSQDAASLRHPSSAP